MVLNNVTLPVLAFQELRPALMMATLARTIRAMRFWVLSMQPKPKVRLVRMGMRVMARNCATVLVAAAQALCKCRMMVTRVRRIAAIRF